MVDPIKVTVELRGEKYFGEITDADSLLFMSAIFNKEENFSMEAGRIEEAVASYKKRSDKRLKELQEQGKSDEDLLSEWGQHLLHRVERDPDIRSLVASRIKERFPTIPATLIRWNGKNDFAISLHIVELLQLLTGIIVPALKLLESTLEPQLPEPIAPADEQKELPAAPVVSPLTEEQPDTPVTPEVVPATDPLKEEIAQLEEMLAQRRALAKAVELESTLSRQRSHE